jgi:hypothetical protein
MQNGVDIFFQCINPNPGPCDYCSRMKYQCQITAQRKHRPLYFTSDEQFQWMITILHHFIPDVALETEGLKAIGASLGISKPESTGSHQTPMRSLPASLEGAYLQRSSITPNQSEGMSEGSQSPAPSETDRDDEVHAAESLITMTDTNDAPSQQSTPLEIRTALAIRS